MVIVLFLVASPLVSAPNVEGRIKLTADLTFADKDGTNGYRML